MSSHAPVILGSAWLVLGLALALTGWPQFLIHRTCLRVFFVFVCSNAGSLGSLFARQVEAFPLRNAVVWGGSAQGSLSHEPAFWFLWSWWPHKQRFNFCSWDWHLWAQNSGVVPWQWRIIRVEVCAWAYLVLQLTFKSLARDFLGLWYLCSWHPRFTLCNACPTLQSSKLTVLDCRYLSFCAHWPGQSSSLCGGKDVERYGHLDRPLFRSTTVNSSWMTRGWKGFEKDITGRWKKTSEI